MRSKLCTSWEKLALLHLVATDVVITGCLEVFSKDFAAIQKRVSLFVPTDDERRRLHRVNKRHARAEHKACSSTVQRTD